jgi:hypothetical protein
MYGMLLAVMKGLKKYILKISESLESPGLIHILTVEALFSKGEKSIIGD